MILALIRQEAARPRSLRIPRGAKHAGRPRVPMLPWPDAGRVPDHLRVAARVTEQFGNPLNALNAQVLRDQLSREWRAR